MARLGSHERFQTYSLVTMKKSNKTKKIRLRTIKPVTIEEFQRIYGISDAKLKKLRKLVGQV